MSVLVQFLSGRSQSCGQPEAFHRETGHRSAHSENLRSSVYVTLTFFSPFCHSLIVSPILSPPVFSFSFSPSQQIKQVQDEERKQLTQLRDVLKSALQVEQKEVTRTHNVPGEHTQQITCWINSGLRSCTN